MLVLHPKADYLFEAMQGFPDAYAFFRYLELHHLRRRLRVQGDGGCRKKHNYAEERIVEKYCSNGDADGCYAERPIPIAPAVCVLVFIGAPAQYGFFRHGSSLRRDILYHRQIRYCLTMLVHPWLKLLILAVSRQNPIQYLEPDASVR